jgi:hypothetical protein
MFLAAPSQCGEIEGAGLQGLQVAGRPVEVSLPASAVHCPAKRQEQSEAARGCPIKMSKDEVYYYSIGHYISTYSSNVT